MRISILVIAALLQGVASAMAYCSKPSAPYCAGRYGSFNDEYEFRSCRSEMESYQSEIEEFVRCNRRESEAALDEYNNAVNSFNNRAGQ